MLKRDAGSGATAPLSIAKQLSLRQAIILIHLSVLFEIYLSQTRKVAQSHSFSCWKLGGRPSTPCRRALAKRRQACLRHASAQKRDFFRQVAPEQ